MNRWSLAGCGAVALALWGVPLPGQQLVPPDTLITVFDSDTIPGMGAVGGVTVDRLGYVYVADFRNRVWRYAPGGSVELFADGLYGSSGNAVGPRGELYQSSFHGNFISRIDRGGTPEVWADSGLQGPVGIAVGEGGALYVANCSGNFVSVVAPDRKVRTLATGALFACPNGITIDDRGDLFVVNFSNTQVIRIRPDGAAAVFADVPGAGGNAHIAFGHGGFYVTKLRAHQVYRVERDGTSEVLAGTGTQGHTDGAARVAQMSQPNGIALSPSGQELWVNELISGNGVGGGVAHSALRRIRLVTFSDVLGATAPGEETVTAAYRAYRTARPREATAGGAVTVAYQFMQGGRFPDALVILKLNAADFPQDPASQYHLGEAYRYARQLQLAAQQYEKALGLDPEYTVAGERLAAVRGE